MAETLSTDGPSDGAAIPPEVAHLAVALVGGVALPSRHRLQEITAVGLGRAEGRDVSRRPPHLQLGLPDPWLSARHARLRPVLHRWALEDLGSRNGSFLNGMRVRSALLSDGDVVQVGHSFFVFRVGPLDQGPDDLDGLPFDDKPPGLATLSPLLGRVLARLEQVARSTESVLIGGETGTGKELVARALHGLSGRPGAFVAVNCGALPEALAEAELFGHRRGAFSGALAERLGYVRAAEGGTLFLDEVADLRPPSQAALLRVLQERQVVALGDERPTPVNVRFCAATHRPLVDLVGEDRFRRDLHARLRGFELALPPLSARREDLGLLLRALLRRQGEEASFKPAAARALFSHPWPYNVRELQQVLGTALALAAGRPIDVCHLPPALVEAAGAGRVVAGADRRPLREQELAHRSQLLELLSAHRGNIAALCRVTGKGRQQIHRWLKRYALDPGAFRS